MMLMTVLYGLILERGVHLYFLGPYPFNLTRRTRRWEQKILFLCCSRAYNLCRVFSDWLITRRRHPTRGIVRRRVYQSTVGLATRTRRQQIPYLCLILRLSSGSSGFVRRYERGYTGRVGGEDKEMWCSGG